MLKKYFVPAMLLMFVLGCATMGGSPLQQADGRWLLSYEATLEASQELKDLVAQDPELEQYMRDNIEGLVLSIDQQRSKMAIIIDNEIDDESDFSLVSEDPESGELIIDINGDKFTMRVQGNTLEWIEDGDVLVFKRMN